jgi:GTPase Era involved in 16S rRNA processing
MNLQYHAEDQKIIVRIPINLRRWGGKKVLVGPQGQDLRSLDLEVRKDEKLLKALGCNTINFTLTKMKLLCNITPLRYPSGYFTDNGICLFLR